jgi:hypothetical protein
VDECLSADRGLYVFDVGQEGLFGLVEDAGMVGDVCLGFLGEVGDFYFCLLLDLHQVLLYLLNFGLVFGYLLLELLLLQIFLVLNPLDLHVQVLLLLQQFAQLILILQLVGDESVEFLSRVVLHELD